MADLFTLPKPLWTPDELVAATGGTWVRNPDPSWLPTGITYMRRLQYLRPGDIFVTMDMATRRRVELRKPRRLNEWDTVDELPTFIAAGISAVIAQRDVPPNGLPLLRVADSGLAVLDLARAARRRFTGKAIAVTGTVGKSTTKEMLRHVLGRQGPTYATMANYNSYFGVPLCLAQTPRDARFAIYENAITSLYREPGPITLMVQPHVAIFTAIGRGLEPHVESLEAIADLKSLMFKGLVPGGVAIVNRDMPLFDRVRDNAAAHGAGRVVTFGAHQEADVRLLEVDTAPEWSVVVASVHGERVTYEVPLPGRPMVMNSLAALAAVHAVGADWRGAAADLASYETAEGRLKRLRVPIGTSDFELIDDSFSAEQASMIANFEVLSLARPRSGGRRIVVLGEIGGLTNPQQTHAELSDPLIATGVDKVFTYGDELLSLRDKLPERMLGAHSQDPRALADAVLEDVRPGDVVSAKGCSITSAFEQVMVELRAGRPSTRIDVSPSAPTGDGPVLTARRKIDIGFLGDTYFGEYYQERRENRGRLNYLSRHGYDYSLKLVHGFLAGNDFAIANLETPLTDERSAPRPAKKRAFHADPEKTLRTLKLANIGALGLASEHVMDFGAIGLTDTLKAIGERGLHAFGAGANARSARRPLRIRTTVKDKALAINVFATAQYDPHAEAAGILATADMPGVCPASDELVEAIGAVKKARPEELVVVLPYWGPSYAWRSDEQTELAGRLTAAGADLVIGHGARHAQEIARVNGRWVIFGLGNFIFNSEGEYDRHDVPPTSLLGRLRVKSGPNGIETSMQLYPIVSNNQVTRFRPRFVSATEFADLLSRLWDRCPELRDGDGGFTTGCDRDGWYLRLGLQANR
ncbi:MAG TPA: CapA family protein [Aestuariivirgaceae bacterium]|nr:CapA family protein [Aestuariivirgaceae bacterium]